MVLKLLMGILHINNSNSSDLRPVESPILFLRHWIVGRLKNQAIRAIQI